MRIASSPSVFPKVARVSVTDDRQLRRRAHFGCIAMAALLSFAAATGVPSEAKAQTTVSVASSGSPSVYGTAVTFTATVTPSTSTGTVTFRDSLTFMGAAALSGGTAQFVKSNLIPGNHTQITATYGTVTSAPISQLVYQNATTTNLTSDVNPSGFGQTVRLTATVTPGTPIAAGASRPTGRVSFTNNSTNPPTLLGTAAVNSSGVATLNVSNLPVGSNNLQACYPGDNNYVASCSSEYLQGVGRGATTVDAPTVSPNPASCQTQDITLRTTVRPADGSDPAQVTGTVRFSSSNSNDGFVDVQLVLGVATTTTFRAATAGTRTITATYMGDANWAGSTSPGTSLSANNSPSSVTVSVDPSPSTWGQTMTICASVSPASATGTITFYDSLTVIGTGNAPNACIDRTTLRSPTQTVGFHTQIRAVYNGDGCFLSSSGSTTHRVQSAPTTLTVTSNNQPSTFGERIRLTASMYPIGATGRVGFRAFSVDPCGNAVSQALGTAALNTLTGLASINVDNLSPGHWRIEAFYPSSQPDNRYMPSTSPQIDQFIEHAPTNTALGSNSNPSSVGETVQLIATVTHNVAGTAEDAAKEAGYPCLGTPEVEFFQQGISIGTAPVQDGGVAVFDVPGLPEGAYIFTAKYLGNYIFSQSLSLPFDQEVVPAAALRTRLSQGLTQLQAEPIEAGVRVSWALADRATFTKLELQRGLAETGPWTALDAALGDEAGRTIADDRTAASGQRYFYRVVGMTQSGTQAVFGPVEGTASAPRDFALSGAWPNPSHGALTMAISLPKASQARVSVLDLQGREVAVLADGGFPAGRHEVRWDGRTSGGKAAAGLYFIRMITPEKKFVSRVAIAQ